MPTHESKNCLRCNIPFECKVGSINLCQCSKVELSFAELEYVNSKYDDCLCYDCLKVLQEEFASFTTAKHINN